MIDRRVIQIILLSFIFFASCSNSSEVNVPMTSISSPAEIDPGSREIGEKEIRSAGKIVIMDIYNLSFSISGQISSIFVKEGDFVRSGDILAELDTTPNLISIAQAEGALELAQARLVKVQAGPHKSEIANAKAQATVIAARPTEVGSDSYDRASEIAAAKALLDYLLDQPLPEDLAVAQAEVTQAQKNVDATKAQLDLARLVAPADGTVIKIFLNTYEFARNGDVVIQIGDLDRLSVQTNLYDFEIVLLNIGDKARVSFDSLPGVIVEGIVTSISPDEKVSQGGSYVVTILLNDHDEEIQWGMTAQVTFPKK